jgi:hypothetical protein
MKMTAPPAAIRAGGLEVLRTSHLRAARPFGEKDARVGPEVGPASALYRCIPAGMHGPACTVWATLTPVSL